MDREKKIVKISLQGIAMNLFLVVFKAAVGLLANSIAIVLDAVNNFSDSISAIITIVGAKLSNKAPDKEHPYGHGRIEYIAATLISAIVFFAGVASFKESVSKIIEPQETNYAWYTLLVIIVAIFIKFFFGQYVKKQGKAMNSQSLVATGEDAFMDSILSLSTLICAIINLAFSLNLEGYVGVIISIMILKSAIEILRETVDLMIGVRADSELTKKLKEKINSYDDVIGTYDLILHSYGPSNSMGSCHIEIKDSMTARKIHSLTRRISEDIYQEFGIILTIGIYASNDSGVAGAIKSDLQNIIKEHEYILQLHGFYVDEEKKRISFDLIIDFKCKEPEKLKDEVINKLKEKYPDYTYYVVIDSDISD